MEGGVATKTRAVLCVCMHVHCARGSGGILPQENICELDAVGSLRP